MIHLVSTLIIKTSYSYPRSFRIPVFIYSDESTPDLSRLSLNALICGAIFLNIKTKRSKEDCILKNVYFMNIE